MIEKRLSLSTERNKPVLLESAIQISFMEWLSLQYPKIEKVTFSIPNGGQRKVWSGFRLKREGMKAGVPDIFMAYPFNGYPGLFLEFKVAGRTTTPEQKEMIRLLLERGYMVRLVFNLQDAIMATNDYLGIISRTC